MKMPKWLSDLLGQNVGVRDKGPEARIQVINQASKSVLGVCIEVADSGEKRRKGLLGRAGLEAGGGLWIVPCESVHTFGMQFPIDLVYLDRKLKVKKVRSKVPAWRMSVCLRAHSILELPAGVIASTGTTRGDQLEFVPVVAQIGSPQNSPKHQPL